MPLCGQLSKNSALFENNRFKKGATWFRICQSPKKGGSNPTSEGETVVGIYGIIREFSS